MNCFKTLEIQKSPLTALVLHPAAPVMASGTTDHDDRSCSLIVVVTAGSHAQFIKILTYGGEQLGSIIK
jgi:hypothetical protein